MSKDPVTTPVPADATRRVVPAEREQEFRDLNPDRTVHQAGTDPDGNTILYVDERSR